MACWKCGTDDCDDCGRCKRCGFEMDGSDRDEDMCNSCADELEMK